MTIKQAIEKAIVDGGYFRGSSFDHDRDEDDTIERDRYQIFLDPLFWQSLGKAMGWPTDICKNCGEVNRCLCGGEAFVPGWEYNWLLFIHNLAEGKDAESFFESL